VMVGSLDEKLINCLIMFRNANCAPFDKWIFWEVLQLSHLSNKSPWQNHLSQI
jgi:hypothetical protein